MTVKGNAIMQRDVQVESRSYDQGLRGSWQGYRLDAKTDLGNSSMQEVSGE